MSRFSRRSLLQGSTVAAAPFSLAVTVDNAIDVLYNGRVFKPAIEEIRLEDGRLRRSWVERLYRILLHAGNAGAEGKWSMRITQS